MPIQYVKSFRGEKEGICSVCYILQTATPILISDTKKKKKKTALRKHGITVSKSQIHIKAFFFLLTKL